VELEELSEVKKVGAGGRGGAIGIRYLFVRQSGGAGGGQGRLDEGGSGATLGGGGVSEGMQLCGWWRGSIRSARRWVAKCL
jgi:hypothetical protein